MCCYTGDKVRTAVFSVQLRLTTRILMGGVSVGGSMVWRATIEVDVMEFESREGFFFAKLTGRTCKSAS